MRFLGIDYGTKRVGVAVSDENNTLAFPEEIVSNDSALFEKLERFIKEKNISEVVVGESVDFSGKPNAVATKIEVFISEFKERFKLPVYKQKEFLTSVEARKSKDGKKDLSSTQAHSKLKDKKRGSVDASAAALILQRYLDRRNKLK